MTKSNINSLADLAQSMSTRAASKKELERKADEAKARILKEQEAARAYSKQFWSEYEATITAAIEMVRAALEAHEDVRLEGMTLQLDEEGDCYEGVSEIYVRNEPACTLKVSVGEEELVFSAGAYFDPLVGTEFEDHARDDCRTALDIANIVSRLIGPAVEKALAKPSPPI